MKTLFLMRHAKAAHESGQEDFDRVLMERGKRDALRMAMRAHAEGQAVDAVISSPAARASETAQIMAEIFKVPPEEVSQYREIYDDQSEASFLQIIRSIRSEHQGALICGHNPGINNLAERLSSEFDQWMPTAALIGISFPVDSWIEIQPGSGSVDYLDYPKRDKHLSLRMRVDLEAALGSIIGEVFPKVTKKQSEAIERKSRRAAKKIMQNWGFLE